MKQMKSKTVKKKHSLKKEKYQNGDIFSILLSSYPFTFGKKTDIMLSEPKHSLRETVVRDDPIPLQAAMHTTLGKTH